MKRNRGMFKKKPKSEHKVERHFRLDPEINRRLKFHTALLKTNSPKVTDTFVVENSLDKCIPKLTSD